jgi:glutaminase
MSLDNAIKTVFGKYKTDLSGQLSQAIPALSQVDPESFAISIATVDGKIHHIGDIESEFTIQSISKPFAYGLALARCGSEMVESKVGVEPTGEDYDSIIKLDDQNRPFNPMVNSGAIVISSMINALKEKTREEELLKYFSSFAGEDLAYDKNIYLSEKEHAEKNWAIAHLLRHFKVITKDFKEDLDLYFRQCSVLLNVDQLAMMGATLANKGIHPLTKKLCISPENLRHMLSIIFTCGMYNYSGEWVFDVGVPAKSGISGAILMIVPGLMGIAVYSPRLDKRGNSVRGIKVCEDLSKMLNLHILDRAGPEKLSDLN